MRAALTRELHPSKKRSKLIWFMLAIQVETVIGILVVLNLVGLTIAAYRIMKKK